MRVNISYSIDFEEVPKTINKIISEAKTESLNQVNKQYDELLRHLTEEDEKHSVKKINSIRKQLAQLDARLSDCANILTGYQKALLDSTVVSESKNEAKENAEG